MAASNHYVDKYNYLFKDVLRSEPEDAIKFSRGMQKEWDEKYSRDPVLAERMKEFKKARALHLVWASDKFGKDLSDEISDLRTYRLLSDTYDTIRRECSFDPHWATLNKNPVEGASSNTESCQGSQEHQPSQQSEPPPCPSVPGDAQNAESGRGSEQQLQQHLRALLYIFDAAEAKRPLSEDLIKHAHRILMNELYTDDKVPLKINAGEYRQCVVGDGGMHTYPDFSSVPSTVIRIVREYEVRSSNSDHDPFALAAWLLHEVLTIHPFEDGNGRISRLLWCYSLLRDGTPFPVTPFPGQRKAYKKYIMCITRDREISLSTPHCKHLTSLTLISITVTWENFILNLRNEAFDKYTEIVKWLEESGNALKHNE